MPDHPAALTTTSYAVLGLLALRPWSGYALAQQMERSLRMIWPRAESRLYDEPRKLVARGLASATREATGRRRTEYTITAAGRAALHDWLGRPGELPSMEFEGLLKVLYADHGDHDAVLATLHHLESEARARLQIGAALAAEYLDGSGPFPDRIHVNALAWEFLRRHHQTIADWAAWAATIVTGWTDTTASPDKAAVALQIFATGTDDPAPRRP